MVKLINALNGGDMWVHESRLEEYLAKGHKLAETPDEPPRAAAKKPRKKQTEQADG